MGREFVNNLVSVIIPIYNSENVIQKSLNSVFNQTYKNIEIILVDDCSTDNSEKIIKEIMKKHNEIYYYKQEKNMGAGATRNKALELAKGQYVAFLDSDDIWYPEKVEKQLKLMKEKETILCYTAIEMIDENENLIKSKRKVKEKIDYKFLLKNTMIPTSSVIIDRNMAGDFRMHIRRGGQDYATWLKILKNGKCAYGINEVLVRYRVQNNSLSSNKLKSIKQIWEIQIEEGISKINICFNIFIWIINSIKKYFL